jgi:hypothetical protein
VAVIAENGGRREDRQKMIVEGRRVAHWINRLAKKVGLTGPTFAAVLHPGAEEIAALAPAADDPDRPPGFTAGSQH